MAKVAADSSDPLVIESGPIIADRPYVPPQIDPMHITKEAYIPLEFAQAKVVEVSSDMHSLKMGYEKYLERLKEYFQRVDENTKSHYESYIAQLKQKALKRIEHEKEVARQKELELQQELATKDEQMEDLRDVNATRISEYQATIHTLKEKMIQTEDEHKQMVEVRRECSAVLSRVLLSVETEEAHRVHESLVQELNCKKEAQHRELTLLQESLQREVEGVKEHEQRVIAGREQDEHIRRETELLLREMLVQMEVDSWTEQQKQHAAAMAKLQLDTSSLQKERDGRAKEIQEQVERCEKQEAEAKAAADKCAELQAQCDEYMEAVSKHKEGTTRLKEELKKRVSTLHATKKDAIFSGVSGAMEAMVSKIEHSDSKKQIKRLKKEVNEESSRVKQLEATVEALRKEVEDKDKQIAAAAAAVPAPVSAPPAVAADAQAQAVESPSPVESAPAASSTPSETSPQPSPVVTGMSAEELAACQSDRQEMLDQLEVLIAKLANLNTSLPTAVDASAKDTEAKAATKNDIKIWMKNFEKENGRPPSNEEKATVKDKFVAHKMASAAAVESAAEVDRIHNEISQTEERIHALEGRLSALAAKLEANPPVSQGSATVESNGLDPEKVKEFEATIAELKSGQAALEAQVKVLETDKADLSARLESIRNEKRTDVVARLEDESDSLRAEVMTLQETIATMKTERTKIDTKMAELKERAEGAEEELKERDEADLRKLNKTEETAVLKTQVTKQRDQIVQKSKAATAGWDAAADAEEKLDTEVERAYKKGLNEGKKIGAGDLHAINESLETKEQRIVELIEKTANAERQCNDAVEQRDAALQQAAEAATALSEARAALARGGKGGGVSAVAVEGSSGGADAANEDALAAIEQLENAAEQTKDELDEVRESLNEAQEEVITLSEEVEHLQGELTLAHKKIVILEKMASSAATNGSSAAVAASAVSIDQTEDSNHLDKLVKRVQDSIVQGTVLWNEQKRDECCDLYAELAKSVSSELKTAAMRDPLKTAVSSAASQSQKRRGAVVLRKALDAFLADSENDAKRTAELGGQRRASKAAAAETVTDDASNSEMDDLKQQLSSLNDSRKPPRNASGAASGGGNALLLKRAKAAEDQVAALRKELAAAERAASRTGGGKAGGGGSSGGGADPLEIKKLQRRIKELESGGGGGGGGSSAADKKALAAAEKKHEKQMKDTEKVNRKEKAALESRISGLEKDLATTTSNFDEAREERDQLRQRVKELGNANAEMEKLREKADQVDNLTSEMNEQKAEIVKLTAQYKKEAQLRKKYKNELEDLKGAIRVYARVRPMAKYEIERNCEKIVAFPDETSVTVQTSRGPKEFEFDAAFTEHSSQDEVFEDTKRLVESMLDGFNVCLFAYGQTGSGKTFTMTGSPDMPGLTPRAIDEMFALIADRPHCTTRVSTYFVELYNDQIVDLYWILDNKRSRGDPPKLDIKLDAKKMVYIKNSVIKEAANAEELMELFRLGNMERHVGSTKMNAESSRSHSIFAVMCESYDSHTKKTVTGKLSLVDLAGSERADKTGAGAERLREAQSINKSLSALGDVISALSEGEKFIPYRNNKLTQLMQDSLGGNAKTLMFVNFSPADYNADETVTSLSYATRVKKITNNASKQAESEEIARLKTIIHKLQHGHAIVEEEEEGGEAEHK